MGFALLTDNLVELYAGGHGLKTYESPRMVANIRGTRLYVEGSLYGRLWKWFYSIAACLRCFRDLRERKLLTAIRATQELFFKCRREVMAADTVYRKSLEGRCRNERIDEESVHKARSVFKNWHDATSPWFTFCKTKESQGMKKWIEECQGGVSGPLFHFDAVSESVRITSKMVALEGCLQEPLPVDVLRKLGTDQPQNKFEKEVVRKFVKKIDKLQGAFSVGDFDDILKALVDSNKSGCSIEQRRSDLAALELALIDEGCRIFLQKDKEFIRLRESYRAGDTFEHQGKTLTLGEPIGKKANPEKDRNVVFTVVEDNSVVLVFGVNRAINGIKDKIAENLDWGIKSVRAKSFDKERRFAVMTKGDDFLNRIEWESSGDYLTDRDLNFAAPIRKLMEWFIDRNKLPFNFSSDYLIFTDRGRIKSLKATLEGPFKFNKLVRYAIQCANGNATVYRFITEPLKTHKDAIFYSSVINNCLIDSPIDVRRVAQVCGVYAADLITQATALHEDIIDFKAKSLYILNRDADADEAANVEKVNKAILSLYHERNCLGFLPDNFEQEMMKSFSKN